MLGLKFWGMAKQISDASTHAQELRNQSYLHETLRHYGEMKIRFEADAETAVERAKAQKFKAYAEGQACSAQFYRNLLNQPFVEIRKYNATFARAHAIAEQTLCDWVVSQKAYKDLCYDFALGMGYDEAEVDEIYLQRLKAIVDGSHPNELVPERLMPYRRQSCENLTAAIDQKNRIIARKRAKSIADEPPTA